MLRIELFQIRKHVKASSTSPNLKAENLISCLLGCLHLFLRKNVRLVPKSETVRRSGTSAGEPLRWSAGTGFTAEWKQCLTSLTKHTSSVGFLHCLNINKLSEFSMLPGFISEIVKNRRQKRLSAWTSFHDLFFFITVIQQTCYHLGCR